MPDEIHPPSPHSADGDPLTPGLVSRSFQALVRERRRHGWGTTHANPREPQTVKSLSPQPLRLTDVAVALGKGWRLFRAMPGPSLILGGLIALFVLVVLLLPFALGVPAVALIIAGAMALIAPLFLPLFDGLQQAQARGEKPRVGLALSAYRRMGVGFWALAGACGFLLLVWITDAGILYAFMVGAGTPVAPVAAAPPAGAEASSALLLASPEVLNAWSHPGLRSFVAWASLMGAALAAGIHLIAGFSLPLLQDGRAPAVTAIHASVRTVFGNLAATLSWGLILVLGLLLGFLLPPLLALIAPVLSYSQYELYRLAFPVTSPAPVLPSAPGPESALPVDLTAEPTAQRGEDGNPGHEEPWKR